MMKLNSTIVATSVVLMLLPLGYSVVSTVFSAAGTSSEPFLQGPPEDSGERCILETEYGINARFHHMTFLKRIRDEAVREGKRGEMSLDDCWECHANSELGTSRTGFCQKCHAAVNLTLGCFQCHYDPDSARELGH